MTTEVASIDRNWRMTRVVNRMSELGVSCGVVCEKNARIGVISERDIVNLCARHSTDAMCASDVMSHPVVSIDEQTHIGEAVALLRERRIRRLPVTDADGRLCGLITQTDLLGAYVGELESAKTTLEFRVAARTDELAEMAARFEALSLEDPLLGIGNRRAMETALDRIVDLAMRYERIFSALLLDVDHFKTFNDLYGHGQGDRALVDVATALRTHQRTSDASYRYGGEEFLVLLPETDEEGAYCLADRLRVAVEQIGRPHQKSAWGVVTVSCGAATFRSGDESWRVVVDRADVALYRAKEKGRNRVESG